MKERARREFITNLMYEASDELSGWDLLRLAIVEQAVSDYRLALRGKIPYDAHGERYFCTVEAIERFFRSNWGEFLCGRDMETMIPRLRRQVLGNKESIDII